MRQLVCLGLCLSSLLLYGGCSTHSAPQSPWPVATGRTPDAASAALQALERAVQGYEQENLKPLETILPVRFLGRGLLLDAARTTLAQQKQIKIKFVEVSYQAGDAPSNSVAISARWEKRFLKVPGGVPAIESGTMQALMRLEADHWVIDALSTDNPLTR